METAERRHARAAFFHWLMALFGFGAGMLGLLLAASGEVPWRSPIVLALMALFATSLACLAMALAGGARRKGR